MNHFLFFMNYLNSPNGLCFFVVEHAAPMLSNVIGCHTSCDLSCHANIEFVEV